jgi:hypothetical protein
MTTLKHLHAVLLLLVLVAPVRADELVLKAGPKGAVIQAGAMGNFILEGPVLALDDKTDHQPTLVPGTDGLSYTLTYDNGFQLHVVISKEQKTVIFSFDKMPDKGQYLRFSMFVPITFNQGGKLGMDGNAPIAIPQKSSGQFVENGSYGEFDLLSPFGQGFSIKMPVSWQGFQDNRVFNWEIYVWDYNYDLKAYPDQKSVAFGFAPL